MNLKESFLKEWLESVEIGGCSYRDVNGLAENWLEKLTVSKIDVLQSLLSDTYELIVD